jgi:hypothetical protein
MPRERSLESLIRTKNKVLASPRFEIVCTPHKIQFFFELLSVDLQDRLEDQTALVESPHFRALPEHQQARLMRLVANDYLLRDKNTQFARDWLRKAWMLTPVDPKTAFAAALAYLHPSLTRLIIRRWRGNTRKSRSISPFEMTRGF